MWYEKVKTKKGTKYKYKERYYDSNYNSKTVSTTLDKRNDRMAYEILHKKITEKTKCETEKATLGYISKVYLEYETKVLKLKSSSLHQITHEVKQIINLFGSKTVIDDMNINFIEEKLVHSGKTTSTQNIYMKRLKAVLNWAYSKEYIQNTVSKKLKYFPIEKDYGKIENKFLEREEADALISYFASKQQLRDKQYSLFIEFMILTGMRFGECAALTYDDIDYNNMTISVNKNYSKAVNEISTPKTRSGNRIIACNARTIQIINEYKKLSSHILSYNNFIFISPTGDHINMDLFNLALHQACKELNINKNVSSHTLRHTHTSLLFEQGISLEAISRRLGHETSDITRKIYLHITDKLKEKEFNDFRKIAIL